MGARFAFSLDRLSEAMNQFSCTEMPIEYSDIQRLNQMRFFHSDPFDRILMSQAAGRGVYLATLDREIVRAYEQERAFPLFSDRAHAARAI